MQETLEVLATVHLLISSQTWRFLGHFPPLILGNPQVRIGYRQNSLKHAPVSYHTHSVKFTEDL